MRRRAMLGLVGSPLAASALIAAEGQEEPAPTAVGVGKDPRNSCLEACEHVGKFSLIILDVLLNDLKEGKGDAASLWKLHRALREIPDICSLVGAAVVRSSPFRKSLCLLCSEACDHCAALAEETDFQHKDVAPLLKECAGFCRHVAQLPF